MLCFLLHLSQIRRFEPTTVKQKGLTDEPSWSSYETQVMCNNWHLIKSGPVMKILMPKLGFRWSQEMTKKK
jgi:hypothetical protein